VSLNHNLILDSFEPMSVNFMSLNHLENDLLKIKDLKDTLVLIVFTRINNIKILQEVSSETANASSFTETAATTTAVDLDNHVI
jgi:hypothetical protein